MIPESYWIAWLVLTASSFGFLEYKAIANKRDGDTLSENTRRWIGLFSKSAPRRLTGAVLFSAVIAGLVGWFIPHIIFGV